MVEQTIYLLRHGQTYWNAESKKKHQTHSNGIGNLLSLKGIEQAKTAAQILKGVELHYAFHTPLTRSKQTLNEVIKYHPSLCVFEKPELNELSLAFLDGMTQDEWEKEFPETKALYDARKKDKFGCKLPDEDYSACFKKAKQIAEANGEPMKIIPNWENYADVMKRTKESFIDKLDVLGNCSILVSGHQGLNRSLLGNFLINSNYISQANEIVNLETPNAVIFRINASSDGVKLYHNIGNGWIEGFVKN